MREFMHELLGPTWHEVLPLYVGFFFSFLELVVQVCRRRRLNPAKVGIMFSEGMAMCLLPIYGYALLLDQELAAEIASKNHKILGVAVFVAFLTLAIHLYNNWFGSAEH